MKGRFGAAEARALDGKPSLERRSPKNVCSKFEAHKNNEPERGRGRNEQKQ